MVWVSPFATKTHYCMGFIAVLYSCLQNILEHKAFIQKYFIKKIQLKILKKKKKEKTEMILS